MAHEITSIGGNCPVQAEGMIDGFPFYFRARGEGWSFSVAATSDGDPVDVSVGFTEGFYYEEDYMVGENFAAGWMEESEARAFIEKAAKLYEEKIMFMQPEMPLYTCHKDVRALKIITLQKLDDEQQTVIMHFAEGEQFSRQVSTINRPKPEEGWYFVDYGDYYSFSPAEKFEAGYTLKQ